MIYRFILYERLRRQAARSWVIGAHSAREALGKYLNLAEPGAVLQSDGTVFLEYCDRQLTYSHPIALIEAKYKRFGQWHMRALPNGLYEMWPTAEWFCGEHPYEVRESILQYRAYAERLAAPIREPAFLWYLESGVLICFYRAQAGGRIRVTDRILVESVSRERYTSWDGSYDDLLREFFGLQTGAPAVTGVAERVLIYQQPRMGHPLIMVVPAKDAQQAIRAHLREQYSLMGIIFRNDGSVRIWDDNTPIDYPHPLALIEHSEKAIGEWELHRLPLGESNPSFCGQLFVADDPVGIEAAVAACRHELQAMTGIRRSAAFTWRVRGGRIVTFYRRKGADHLQIIQRFVVADPAPQGTRRVVEWNGSYEELQKMLLI